MSGDPVLRPSLSPLKVIATLALLLLSVVFAVSYRIADGAEHHSYNVGALAPDMVHVTSGHQYEISIPGGVSVLNRRGVDVDSLTCTYSTADSGPQSLTITSLGNGTRTTHAVATFIGPTTGMIHIDCPSLGSAAFVDDADNAAGDPAGLFVLLTTITLTFGIALLLSVLYDRFGGGSARPVRRHPEFETQADNFAGGAEAASGLRRPLRGDRVPSPRPSNYDEIQAGVHRYGRVRLHRDAVDRDGADADREGT